MKGYIYLITNVINKKTYVGQTKQFYKERWKEHISAALSGSDRSPKLYKAFRKYGVCMFDFEVLAEAVEFTQEDLQEKLNRLEIYFIKKYKSTDYGYNCTLGGSQVVNTEHTIYKISKSKQKIHKLDKFDRLYNPRIKDPGYLDIYEANELNDMTNIQFWPDLAQ